MVGTIIALLSLAATASADPIQFSTFGYFGSPAVQPGVSPATYDFMYGTEKVATIEFTGNGGLTLNGVNVGDEVSLNTLAGQSFGSFRVKFYGATDLPSSITQTVPFELTISQTSPSSGTGYSDGKVTGRVNLSDVNGSFKIDFLADVSSTQIGSIIYTPSSTTISALGDQGVGTFGSPTSLGGTVSVAPLPATATTGLSLLAGTALVGGLTAVRRRRAGMMA
jgi:hypothetical protein